MSFRILSSSSTVPHTVHKRETSKLLKQVESVLQEGGFDVERIQTNGDVLAPALLERETKERTGVDGRADHLLLKKPARWLARLGFVSLVEREKMERRRRHVAHCAECQREDRVGGDEDVVDGETEGIEVKVETPLKPTIVETVFLVKGMFCGYGFSLHHSVVCLLIISLSLSFGTQFLCKHPNRVSIFQAKYYPSFRVSPI